MELFGGPQPLYDGLFLASFNLVFTSLPILAFGLLDQDFSADRLLRELHLYRDFTDNALMNWKQIAKWSLTGMSGVDFFFSSCFFWRKTMRNIRPTAQDSGTRPWCTFWECCWR